MELAVDYDHTLRQAWRWQVYVGLAGEPALLPPVFASRYGGRAAPGFGVFVNLRPARHAM